MASAVARPRGVAWLVVALVAAAAVGYGAGFEKMPLAAPLVMLGLGGATLGLAGLAIWRSVDPLLRGRDPVDAGPAAGTGGPAATSGRLRELEREKQAVLKAIKEIELDFQMRKVAKADYDEMIERYRARAMRLIAEVDAGDDYRELIERELKARLRASVASEAAGAPLPAPPAARACGRCGTRNDDDAEFCKKCGSKLSD